ncbi:MAG: hypothetical protein U9R44_02515 [Candidatus Omnitrophota bacterium]|nr:hypothetical protein [Candidatus Omnitrophota bacterium]
MKFSKNKIRLFAGLVFLSLIFICLRLKTINHLLMWDEAWNILSLRAYVLNAAGDPFYWFYYYHPPFYMAFARILSPLAGGFDVRLELLSLVFCYGTFLTVYLISAKTGGWRYAWFTGLFLSFMPCSIGYDTWIKRDSLASLLGYLALLLLLNRRFMWCAVSLSFSLLSKENGIFFVLSAFLMLFVLGEKRPIRKILSMGLVILALCSWWYVFFSKMTTHGARFFSAGTKYALVWANEPLYFVKKLLPDLGTGILFFLVIGLCFLPYKAFFRKKPGWFLPVMVVLCVYIPVSFFFTLKPPWLILPALPALAMTAGGGALYLLRRAGRSRILYPALLIFLAITVFNGLYFSYEGYHTETYPKGWPGARASRELALYLNERMKDDDRLMITGFEYWQMPTCPIFLYYWKQHPIKTIRSSERSKDVIDEIIKKNISWFVVVGTPDPSAESNFRKLAEDFSYQTGQRPGIAGWSYVWKTDALWKDREN